jgi:cbb3-type cytochrome oxidase maturation protein
VSVLVVLIPVSLLLGGLGLAACLWTMRSGQYEDLDGAAARILIEGDAPSLPDTEDEDPR